MVWVMDKGMYSPMRRQEDLLCTFEALCKVDLEDGEVATMREGMLADFVEQQARRLPRMEFLKFTREVYARIDTLLRGWVPSQRH